MEDADWSRRSVVISGSEIASTSRNCSGESWRPINAKDDRSSRVTKEMNSEDVRDQNDDNKWREGDREKLRTVLPVLFEPEHSFIDFLIALIEQAKQGSTVFEERYRQSTIDYDCGDYCALVHLDIDPDCAPWQTDDHIFISRIYLHPQFGAKSNLFRRRTQLTFEVITRIGELIAQK